MSYVKNKLKLTYTTLEKSFESSYENKETLPDNGLSSSEMNSILKVFENNKHANKQISGVIYHGDESHKKKLMTLFNKYAFTNPLHPDIFPEIREMEIDIINMTRSLFLGDHNVSGNVTSGGTESILLACYTYREWGRKERGITNPNIITFNTVHPAFDKACHYFNIKIIKVSSFWKMKWKINRNTICVVGSAPDYAYGLMDPIEEMSNYCKYYKVPFHVDACMGGFLIPFLDNNVVHFNNSGITSISADTHKYGYALKGSSVLLFSHPSFKNHQHYVKTDWCGGIYATPTMLGSKSGAIIAATWASLLYIGKTEYTRIAKLIQLHTQSIREKFRNNPYVEIVGNPNINIIAFKSSKINIYKVVAKMENWNLSVMANPPAFHLCITAAHTEQMINNFNVTLEKAIKDIVNHPNEELSGTLAVYGSSAKIENSLFTQEVIGEYIGLFSKNNISIY
jgi:sphinganine-1-phosphate aldolase